MTLADARAVLPGLEIGEADPATDLAGLEALARWCGRYSPWTALDGEDGIIIETTGCDHLFGGETALLADIVRRLGRAGIEVRPALADTPAAAWALARFRPSEGTPAGPLSAPPIAPSGETMVRLAALPIQALRLPPETVEGLERLGLRRIGALYRMSRAGLGRRFGPLPFQRLDKALGRLAEPISPLEPSPEFRVRLDFGEPIAAAEDIARAAGRLIERLADWLAREERGAHRLDLAAFRADGGVASLSVGCARATRDATHWRRLFAERLGSIDPGFGVDLMIIAAPRTERLAPAAPRLTARQAQPEAVERLVDRLRNRLGGDSVAVLRPLDSHLPERAAIRALPFTGRRRAGGWARPESRPPRPTRLLPVPEPVEALAATPDHPPHWFRWRRIGHRVVAAEGPERIAPEWWHDMADKAADAAGTRDYFRVEDETGRRFWLYRAGLYGEGGALPRWYLHGLF